MLTKKSVKNKQNYQIFSTSENLCSTDISHYILLNFLFHSHLKTLSNHDRRSHSIHQHGVWWLFPCLIHPFYLITCAVGLECSSFTYTNTHAHFMRQWESSVMLKHFSSTSKKNIGSFKYYWFTHWAQQKKQNDTFSVSETYIKQKII